MMVKSFSEKRKTERILEAGSGVVVKVTVRPGEGSGGGEGVVHWMTTWRLSALC
jgi:hypothetical protein